MRIGAAIPLKDLTERDWERQIVNLAKTLGWRCYHTLRSKGSQPGFPDWTLVRDRVVFLELKREDGKLSEPQKEWLGALLSANAEAYVARPRDLVTVGKILAARSGVHIAGLVELRASTAAEVAACRPAPKPTYRNERLPGG